MTPEGIKTEKSDRKVTEEYADLHLRIGIKSLHELINKGMSVKHLRF
jgi:AMP nucleosidase